MRIMGDIERPPWLDKLREAPRTPLKKVVFKFENGKKVEFDAKSYRELFGDFATDKQIRHAHTKMRE